MAKAANSVNISDQGVQYFDGTASFVAAPPVKASYVLTDNGPGNAPTFQPAPTIATLTYYLTDTASSVASELQLTPGPFTPKTTLTFAGLAAGNDELQDWITNAGVPNLSFIPAGTFLFHIHASQSAGTKNTVLYAEFWEANSTGVDIAKIGTTETTPALTGSEVEYPVAFVTANIYTMASTASRIKVKVFATVSGGGSAPTVLLYVGDTADSHISLPSQSVDATNFVPYTGATADVNLGTHAITANSATLTNPLTVANGGTGHASFTAYAPVCGGTTTTGAFQSASTGIGTSGFVLTSNGSAALPSFQVASISTFSTNIQVFTSTGTYTPTSGMLYCIIECLGGGGAGGGSPSTSGTQESVGAGGGAGEYARGVFSAATIGASQSVTIGAAGTPASGTTGGNGGNTSVGSTLISANGGTGGGSSAATTTTTGVSGSLGGTGGTGGSFRTPGQAGFYGLAQISGGTPIFIFSGQGGSSQYGAGGISVQGASGAGSAGLGYGAGGAGASNLTSQSARSGGSGTAGIVIVTEYINAASINVTGTFTPALNFGGATTGITYSAQAGVYTRIGNSVWFAMELLLTSKGSATGSATITGMPFTSNGSWVGADYVFFAQNLTTAPGSYNIADFPASTTTLTLFGMTQSTGTATALTNSNFQNGSNIRVEGFYQI